MLNYLKKIDRFFVEGMRKHGIGILRVSLGIVFLWFGILKILNASPIALMIKKTYSFFPFPEFLIFLGVWEVLIGIGLTLKIFLRTTLVLLWLQIGGTFAAIFFYPLIFFHGNPFFLTIEGEFVLKNLIILAASIVIGGYRIPNSSSKS